MYDDYCHHYHDHCHHGGYVHSPLTRWKIVVMVLFVVIATGVMIGTYVWYAYYAESSITYHDGRSEIFLEGSEHTRYEGLQLPQGVYNVLGKKHRPILDLGFLDPPTSSIYKPSPILGFLDQQTSSIFVRPTYSSIYDKPPSRYSPPRYTSSSARRVVRPTKLYAVRVQPSKPAQVRVNPSKRLG